MAKIEHNKWSIVEKERIYEALTSYDSSSSYLPNTKVSINMDLFKPNSKPEDYAKKEGHGFCCLFLARVTSQDGMCHMTFDIISTASGSYFEIEFYDILYIGYSGPKMQKIHDNLSQYIEKLYKLPSTVEEFVELLLKYFEALQPLLEKVRLRNHTESQQQE